MFRAVVVGFVLGFAMVGGARLTKGNTDGAQLTSAQALHKGAALDRVAGAPCVPGDAARAPTDGMADSRPFLLLI